MTDPLLQTGEGQTELAEDERVGLLPTFVSTRRELFDAEQRNIAQALLGRRPEPLQLLDSGYLRSLHRRMFGEVWGWAGSFRVRETNIGIDPAGIAVALRNLIDDTRSWLEYGTYEPDELAVRFHHCLVAIHPFPNGNGRHARIAADYLIQGLGHPAFSWGANLDVVTEHLRSAYLQALRGADRREFDDLVRFARS